MKSAPLAEVKAHLTEYVDECASEGPLVITRKGKAVAVLLTPTDDDDLQRLLLGSFASVSGSVGEVAAQHSGWQRTLARRFLESRSRTK
jgi:prevent-host-death family protein